MHTALPLTLCGTMEMRVTKSGIVHFLRRQQSYIAVAVAIYAALWATDRTPSSLGSMVTYTLFLCNFIVFMQDDMGLLNTSRRALPRWILYSLFLPASAAAAVVIANVIEYPAMHRPGQSLLQFEESGWKMPFVATMIFGVSRQLYRATRERLERKNRELQRTVELEIAERELQGQELQQAREIQRSLLPQKIPQVAGFEIDGAWEPARVVGGDYFDVIRLSETKLAICIADVVGKSVSAALLMANVQASVRAFTTESTSPSRLCSRVNSVLCSCIGTGKFVTLFYGVLDGERRSFHYTNAGHLFPILIRATGQVQELENGGAVLGVFPAWKYEDSGLQFEPGDRLLLFTDGITEAGLPEDEEFGGQRLIAGARRYGGKSTSELKSCLLADVQNYCSSQLQDDATLLVVSALPRTPSPVIGNTGPCAVFLVEN